MSNSQLGILLFLQLSIILAVVRLVGMAARKIGQPQVVGEMIAGVILGPSICECYVKFDLEVMQSYMAVLNNNREGVV